MGALTRTYLAMTKHHDQKQFEEDRIYFNFQLSGDSVSPREVRAETQGRNLEAEAEAEATDECCLLAFSPWLAQPACLYNLPRGATIHSELNPPPYLSSVKKMPPLAWSLASSLWSFHFLNNISLCSVDEKNSQVSEWTVSKHSLNPTSRSH